MNDNHHRPRRPPLPLRHPFRAAGLAVVLAGCAMTLAGQSPPARPEGDIGAGVAGIVHTSTPTSLTPTIAPTVTTTAVAAITTTSSTTTIPTSTTTPTTTSTTATVGTLATLALGWLSTSGVVVMGATGIVVLGLGVAQLRARAEVARTIARSDGDFEEVLPVEVVTFDRPASLTAEQFGP